MIRTILSNAKPFSLLYPATMILKNRRIFLPATLLILVSALSCSTACITAAIIESQDEQLRRKSYHDAEVMLLENRRAQTGTTSVPTITADPRSIEEALRPALPTRSGQNQTPYFKSAEVVLQPEDASGMSTYVITVYGDFSLEYAHAFEVFCRTLRKQLPGKNRFIVDIYSGMPADRIFVDYCTDW